MPDTAVSLPARAAGALAQLLVTLWVGGMWTVGYVAAPVLFGTLDDRMLAGEVAGRLFAFVAWIGMGTAGYLLVFLVVRRGRAALRCGLFWVTAVLLACVTTGYFGLQAEMAALKADVGSMDVMESASRERFAMLHGAASAIYLAQSVLGAWLAVGMKRHDLSRSRQMLFRDL
ncbi:MAG: DUF4149 domain-containing protein [Candidatus Accumulibacter sp.]|jgi:hypothetical protein|nr:DUF4149 domain-containing protein [Accumulibacter sp.]